MLLHNMYLLDLTFKIMMYKDCASVCVCTSKYKAVIMYELDVVVWMIQWKFVSLCLMFKHTGIKCTAIIYSQFGSNCTITSWFSVRDLHNYMQYFWNPQKMFKCFWIIFGSVTYTLYIIRIRIIHVRQRGIKCLCIFVSYCTIMY